MPRTTASATASGGDRERRGLHAVRSSSCARSRAGRSARARRSPRATPQVPGSSRRCPPSTSRTRSSSAARARPPPTTAARACRGPASRSRSASGTVTETVPVKFVCTMSTAAAGSCSARAWSPSTPNATSTRSKSPKRSNVVRTKVSCDGEVGGVERHRVRPRTRRLRATSAAAASHDFGLARREHDARRRGAPRSCARSRARCRRCRRARAPTALRRARLSCDAVSCRSPSSCLRRCRVRSRRRSMSLRSSSFGIERGARGAPLVEARVHRREQLRAAGVSPW